MKAMTHAFYLVLIPAALAQPVQQTTSSQMVQPLETQKPGVLDGRVINAKTGEPVRRVNLTLRPFGPPGVVGGMIGPMGPMAPAAPYAATTDAEGRFRIENVEPGSYRMMAERQGFVRQEYGARQSLMMGTTIKVAPGQELKNLEFKLTPQAVISGRVVDEEGEPLAKAQIQVLRQRYFRGRRQLMPQGGGMTIDTGEFRIAELAPGRYWLSASYRGRMMMMFGEGPARNTGGKPEEEYVTTFYPGSTDAAGARPIDLVAGQELHGMDIRMQKARVYRISGKVTSPAAVQNIRLALLPRENTTFARFMMGGGGIVKPDGTFEIGSVAPGSYYVTALPMQGAPAPVGKVAVDVTQQNVDNVLLTLAGGFRLTGSIRVDGDVQQLEQAQGKKLTFGSVRVQLTPMEGMPFGTPPASAKEDGTFVFENVSPDKYRIMAFGVPQGTWVKSVRAGDREVLDEGLDMSGGVPGLVLITLGVGVGQITGMVQDGKQQPAAGSLVTLLPDPLKEERNDLYRMTTADQNGQFTMQGIPPGEYKLIAWEDIDPGSYMDPEFLKPHESRAQKVTVQANSPQQVSLTQIPAEASAPR